MSPPTPDEKLIVSLKVLEVDQKWIDWTRNGLYVDIEVMKVDWNGIRSTESGLEVDQNYWKYTKSGLKVESRCNGSRLEVDQK